MDNSDVIQIVGKIGEVHSDLKNDISSLRAEFSGFKGATEVRLNGIEDDIKTTRKRQWMHSTIVMPGLAALHGIMNHFGVKL